MDYEGLYKDLLVIRGRVLHAICTAEGNLLQQAIEFDAECGSFLSDVLWKT